jgi:preprotein translocase subunit SecA
VAAIMDRFGQKEMEPIETPMISRAIAGAQKRVETRNAEIRKHLLEYDDVMNKQREVVYRLRDQILAGTELKEVFHDIAANAIADMVGKHAVTRHPEDWNWAELRAEFGLAFLADFETPGEELPGLDPETLVEKLTDIALARFEQRRQQLGDELFGNLLKAALLRTLDARWRDHLYALDMVREGINLRAYGQKDPLLEYKQESFKLFDEMMTEYRREAITFLFRAELTPGAARPEPERRPSARPLRAYKPEAVTTGEESAPPAKNQGAAPVRRAEAKVGRNDPCPCGSGKKYKKCCGQTANG